MSEPCPGNGYSLPFSIAALTALHISDDVFGELRTFLQDINAPTVTLSDFMCFDTAVRDRVIDMLQNKLDRLTFTGHFNGIPVFGYIHYLDDETIIDEGTSGLMITFDDTCLFKWTDVHTQMRQHDTLGKLSYCSWIEFV